jgi:hypothetical protein
VRRRAMAKIPKAALIATGEEGQEPYDGSGAYVEADADHVEIDEEDMSSSIRGEEPALFQPDFETGDQEWDVDEEEDEE